MVNVCKKRYAAEAAAAAAAAEAVSVEVKLLQNQATVDLFWLLAFFVSPFQNDERQKANFNGIYGIKNGLLFGFFSYTFFQNILTLGGRKE